MYRVVKELHFCYGHRLLEYDGKCRWLHGHNARVEIELTADTLDGRGMVTDFGDIKSAVLGWIDENLDHRMILREDDPWVAELRRRGEPVYTMKENPTAEAIARLLYERVRALGFPATAVRLWEAPSARAEYRGQPS